MCQFAMVIVAVVLGFFGMKLLRENREADSPEKRVNPAIPITMLVVAGFLVLVAIVSVIRTDLKN